MEDNKKGLVDLSGLLEQLRTDLTQARVEKPDYDLAPRLSLMAKYVQVPFELLRLAC